MEWSAWRPFYHRLLDDFGYSEAADRRCAELLDELLDCSATDRLRRLFADATVLVAGDGPTLERGLEDLDPAGYDAVVAADGAARRLRGTGVGVDVATTDLDGAPEACLGIAEDGGVVAIHAHGDNADAVEAWAPRFPAGAVVGTAQCWPPGRLLNHGGFTDGDRAAYIADACGAAAIDLVGFALHDPAPSHAKRWKLRWAELLLRALEDARGEPLFA